MNDSSILDWEEILRLAMRMKQGYQAFCAHIDLLGTKSYSKNNPREMLHRLDDFQQGFGDALVFFPGGEDYHVCFLADTILVVKELEGKKNSGKIWQTFCGHVYALASVIHDMEINIGNPGVRMIISYGRLSQLFEPDSWRNEIIARYTENWFVLTGKSDALMKCDAAQRQGSKKGFLKGYCWHEIPNQEYHYLGTPIFKIPLAQYQIPHIYSYFYRTLLKKATKKAILKLEDDISTNK